MPHNEDDSNNATINTKKEMENVYMANVAPPEPFNFLVPENWAKWRKRFERYLNVSGQSKKSQAEQIDLLFYIMGEKSEEVLLQLKPAPTTLAGALQKFDSYFNPKTNVIFERFKFNSRVQGQGESIDTFITELHALAENCEYGDLKEQLIRDRIVVGMLNTKVSEQMQLKSDLTLKMAADTARQAELQVKQSKIIKDDKNVCRIEASDGAQRRNQQRGSQGSGFRGYGNYNNKNGSYKQNNKGKNCNYCGYGPHERKDCPAKDKNCNICKLRGHFANVCNKKQNSEKKWKPKNVNAITTENQNSENHENSGYMIGTVKELRVGSVRKAGVKPWYVECSVSGLENPFNFLLDTGADCVCIPKDLIPENHKLSILKSCTRLKGPDDQLLKVSGVFETKLIFKKREFADKVYIVEGLSTPILGRSAMVGLDIFQPPLLETFCVMKNEKIDTLEKIIKEFPRLFRDIGEFKGEVNIRLKPEVTSFVQTVPRKVPIPLLPKLKTEIDRLINLDVIERIDAVTEWVSPIVVVPKPNNEIRLCVDYTQLNKAVIRPYFPMPKIELSLAKIKRANIFSKIDANKGFYQIKLSHDSQLMTCFICPFGRFIFKRLPFGISCAPEYFVSKFSKVLDGIDNCISHVDDILIFAEDRMEHDAVLRKVLARLDKEGITINKEKSCFGVDQVTYLGYVLSSKGISVDPDRIRAIIDYPKPENKTEVQRFLGMVNFVAKFIPNRAKILEPINF